MPFQIIRNDITKVKADAIVNTANPDPVIGSGTDRAIYTAAGEEELLSARKGIGAIIPGNAAYTSAYHLDAKYIIHTVGPAWEDGNHREFEMLHSCYEKSLTLAAELSCKSIAFPLIATGVYGFPKDEALQIALFEINKFLLSHDMQVILVVFDKKAFELSGKLVGSIEQYIDEHTVLQTGKAEYTGNYGQRAQEELRRIEAQIEENRKRRSPVSEAQSANDFDDTCKSLEDILNTSEETFQQRLLRLIDESEMNDVEVYKKANVDRKVFSRIRSNIEYRPKKKTAVAFAIALELNLEEMRDLLARAEIAFLQFTAANGRCSVSERPLSER